MEIVEVLQQASCRRQRSGIIGFELVFVGQNNTDFNVIFCYASCFQKVNFQEFNLCTYINFELPSSFLSALCMLLEEQAVLCGNNRSSRPEVFCEKGVLRHFAKFTGKYPYQRLFFNKVADLACNFIKNNLWHRCFPVNFAKFLGTPFLQNTSGSCF